MAKKEGFKELIEGLENLNRQFPEINRAAIATIARDAVRIAKRNVEAGGDPTEPHSEFTAELTKKLRGGTTKDVLNETGKLAKSIRIMTNTVAMGSVYVEIGSKLVYAAIQEFGGTTGGALEGTSWYGYIPPRPYLRPAIAEAIENAKSSDLNDRLKQAYELAIQKKAWKHLFPKV